MIAQHQTLIQMLMLFLAKHQDLINAIMIILGQTIGMTIAFFLHEWVRGRDSEDEDEDN